MSVPQTLHLPSTSVPAGKTCDLNMPCPKHKRELIKFYCHDHSALVCSVCVTLEHTVNMCKVNYIPDISGKIIDSKEYHDILKAMDTISNKYHKMSADVKKMTVKSNGSVTNVLAGIKKFRKEINQRLDELERQAEDAAKAIQQENDKNLKTLETASDDITKSLETSADSIKHLNTLKQADRLFMELKYAEQMIKEYKKTLHQLSAYNVKEYSFEPNEVISSLLEADSSLGDLSHKTLKLTSLTPAVKPRQTLYPDEICIKTSKDNSSCWITGMTLLTPDLLIITDHNNSAVKMVEICNQSVTDQLKLDGQPYDVTAVTGTELAVTLHEEQTIQFVSTTSNKLVKKHTMNVDGKCYGISSQSGKLVVSFMFPVMLQILDTNGTILTTIRGENIFRNPTYVTTNSSSIYVSDWRMKTVTRLNWQGDVIGSYGGIGQSRGITLSDDGTVFVCDSERKAVVEVTADCSKGKVVLKDLKWHRAVCLCTETCRLYISSDTGFHKDNNSVQMFNLSKTCN